MAWDIAAIDELIDDKREETLHLEFKTLSGASHSSLAKEDRKTLAKAICGFANAEGGTLIIGIETAKVDGLDVAIRKRSFDNLMRMRSQVAAIVPELLSPQHAGISISSVAEASDSSQGLIVVEVPPSDRRPHMSNNQHQYFRRGSDGTRLLEHSEIRELMLSTRNGALELQFAIRAGVSTGDLKMSLDLMLELKNTGSLPVKAPYVRINKGNFQAAIKSSDFQIRAVANRGYGIYSTPNVLVHVEDAIAIAKTETGIRFQVPGQTSAESAINVIRKNYDPKLFCIQNWSEMLANQKPDKEFIEAAGYYGAENVLPKPFDFHLRKQDLFELISSGLLGAA
jgi:hypothetical protein